MANFYAKYPGSGMPSGTGSNVSIVSPIGQTVMASSVSVAIASDQSTVPVSFGGLAYADSIRLSYASTSVGATSWVQLIASTAATIQELYINDTGGQAMELGVGAAASETRVFLYGPGGVSGKVSLKIAAGSRLSIRCAKSATTVSTNEVDITGLG